MTKQTMQNEWKDIPLFRTETITTMERGTLRQRVSQKWKEIIKSLFK
jgi:hypothetical protein